MNLTFRQLQTFVAVMRRGSLTEAARVLGRTQPSVSAMIASLEEQVGFQLFTRDKKRLIAKPEAYFFLEEAEEMLARLEQSTRTLREVGNLKKGVLRVACNPAAEQFFLPDLISRFLASRPDVEVSLAMRSSPVVADSIASQNYDLGLGERPEPRKTINAREFAFPCLCALHKSNVLVEKKLITPFDLAGTPLATLYEDHMFSRQTRRVFEDAGVALVKRFESRTFSSALLLASRGLCAVVCDSFSALSYKKIYGEGSMLEFRPFQPSFYLNMALLTPASRPLSLLTEQLSILVSSELEDYLSYRG